MIRLSRGCIAWAGLGLTLVACVPLDGETTTPPSADTAAAFESPPATPFVAEWANPGEVPRADLQLHQFTRSELEKRIAELPPSMAAHQIRQGMRPFRDAEPGSENVLLAEQLSTSGRFALPRKTTGDTVLIEVTCSRPMSIDVMLFDADSEALGGGSASTCSPGTPHGFGIGMWENPQLGQVQLVFDDADVDAQLSLVMFESTTESENFE